MKGYVLFVWSLFDPIYYFFSNLSYLSDEKEGGNIFRIKLTKYKGKHVVLSDGTKINKNDTLVKIHLHNVRLLRELKDIKSELKKAKIIYRYVQNSLPGVEHYIRKHSLSHEIKGIIGITSINKGSERLGFETIDISHPVYKMFKRFAFLPIVVLSSQTASIKNLIRSQQPSYLFMSTNQLSKMYRY